MTKTEFLEALEMKLSGEVNETLIRQNLHYYSDYIDTAIRNGKSEWEVTEELGSPLLIARTIIETAKGNGQGGFSGNAYQEEEEHSVESKGNKAFHLNVDAKSAKWIFLIAVILLLVLLFTVLRLLMPILLPILVIILIFKVFKKD